jgi:hypothetical protein
MSNQLTLGELIISLNDLNGDLLIEFSGKYKGKYPTGIDQYRGYHYELILEISYDFEKKSCTVAELLKIAKNIVNKDFEGSIGGKFYMDESTPLWAAYNHSLGYPIIGISKYKDKVLVMHGKE